jgi:hypothetical protein
MSLTEATQSELAQIPVTAAEPADDPSAMVRGAVGPWTAIRGHARSIGVAAATCLVVLTVVELAFFRSGFFESHVAISNPQTPLAKIALAARHPETRVLYVGDSTIMTSVLPTTVTAVCDCGPGFNAGFSAATPWRTRAMTERLLMSPSELEALGASVPLDQRIDAAIADSWSAYGQRVLLKEWVSAFAPSQRYDESLLGYWVAPGSANSYARVVAAADRLFANVGDATMSAPGATAIGSLLDELRARGIRPVVLLPPLHPASYEIAGPYLREAEAAIRELAAAHRVPLVDCRAVVDGSDFRDATHILPEAVDRHSRCVGEQLRALALD